MLRLWCTSSYAAASTPSLQLLLLLHTLFISTVVSEQLPTFHQSANNITVNENDRAILPCTIDNLGSHTVAWQDPDNNPISMNKTILGGSLRYRVENRVPNEWTLEIDGVLLSETGAYTCVVNTQPARRKIVFLSVIKPPKILGIRSSNPYEVAVEGDTMELRCIAEGHPKPVITWFRGKNLLSNRGEVLTLRNVSRGSEAVYECRAQNQYLMSDSYFINVTVHYLPVVRYVISTVRKHLYEEALLECDVEMNPVQGKNVEVKWLNSANEEVLYSHRHLIKVDTSGTHKYQRRTSLRISQLQKLDFGVYTCLARNSIGTATATISLEEEAIILPSSSSTRHVTSLKTSVVSQTNSRSTNRLTSTTKPTADGVVLGAASLRVPVLLLLISAFISYS